MIKPAPESGRAQDGYALALVLVQAAVFGYLSKSVAFPVAVCVAAVAGCATTFRVTLPPERRFLAAMLLSLLFAAKWIVAPHEPADTRVFLQYALVHAVGQYFLTLQAAQFLVRRPGERLTSLIPLFGSVVLVSAADIYVTRTQLLVYQSAVIAFALLTAGFYGAIRTFTQPFALRRGAIRGFVELSGLAISAAVAWGGCVLLHRNWDTLERWFDPQRDVPQFAGMGFSRQARLGSIEFRKTQQSDATALRVYAPGMPGYLRGAAFDQYADASWDALSDNRTLAPMIAPSRFVPKSLESTPAFILQGTPSDAWTSLEIWKDPQVPDDAVFAPLGTSVLEAATDSLTVDEHDVALSSNLTAGQPLAAHVPADLPVGTLSPEMARRLTRLPELLRRDPQLADLAEKVFAGCRSPRDKVAAAERWFRDNYRYSLQVHVPSTVEPVRWFLLDRPAAHCEFFASGAAVLLRLAGVPCRYVTGFVAAEHNPAGGYWLARNRDAHAWVEAWDPGTGWVTVEATPSEGVPATSSSLTAGHILDDLWLRILRIRAAVARTGWRGVLSAMWTLGVSLFTTIPGIVLLTMFVAWCGWFVLRSVRWSPLRRDAGHTGALQRLLSDADRRVAKFALQRLPSETLHQFAARVDNAARQRPSLAAAAGWYRDYAQTRYRGDVSPADVSRLRQNLV